MEVSLGSPNDPAFRARYDSFFESCPGAFIQQSCGWADAIAALGPDEPRFLLCRDGGTDVAGLPLYIFKHPLGSVMNSVPQPGPLGGVFIRPGLQTGKIAAAFAALLGRAEALAREENCLSMTLISNPFSDDISFYRSALGPCLVLKNFTQHVPLDGAPRERSGNVERNIRKARAQGWTASMAGGEAELERWQLIHEKRQAEIGARPLPLALFRGLWRQLFPRGKAGLLLVRRGDELAGGGFFVRHREVLDLYMPAIDSRFAKDGTNFLAVEECLSLARAGGARVFNWQSSPDRTGGVYAFKKQWGSVETSYYFLTKLLTPPERLRAVSRESRAEYAGHYVAPHAFFERADAAAEGYFEK